MHHDKSFYSYLRVSPDEARVSSLGDESLQGVSRGQSARLVQGVVTQPASLGPSLQARLTIGGHDVPGLQELD